MIGNIIARELTVTRNWPLASSISVVLTVITTVGVILFMRLNRNTLAVKNEKNRRKGWPEMSRKSVFHL